jgi:hypothetical protein
MGKLSVSTLLVSVVLVLGTGSIVFLTYAKSHAGEVLGASQHQAVQVPSVVLAQAGHDSAITQPFSADGDWNLLWTYDCSKTGHQGNFEIAVFYRDGVIANLPSVNQFGTKDSGEEHYTGNESYYLAVSSLCSWTVTVKQ